MVATSTTPVPSVHNGQSFVPVDSTDTAPPGSWELVRATQAGDRDAFGELYRRYAGKVTALVLARTGDQVLAQDLTSETFARALRRVDSVSEQGRDVGAWLSTIARNLVKDYYKSSQHRFVTPVAEFNDEGRFLPSGYQHQPAPEQVVIERETAERLARHVEALPVDQRVCLGRRFTQGLSVAETATAMSRSEGAVKALQHRATTGLRASLTAEDQTAARAEQRSSSSGDPLERARVAVAAAETRASTQARAQRGASCHALSLAPDHSTAVGGEPVVALEVGRHG